MYSPRHRAPRRGGGGWSGGGGRVGCQHGAPVNRPSDRRNAPTSSHKKKITIFLPARASPRSAPAPASPRKAPAVTRHHRRHHHRHTQSHRHHYAVSHPRQMRAGDVGEARTPKTGAPPPDRSKIGRRTDTISEGGRRQGRKGEGTGEREQQGYILRRASRSVPAWTERALSRGDICTRGGGMRSLLFIYFVARGFLDFHLIDISKFV